MLGVEALRVEVERGLSSDPPTLPPKLFYDEEGTRLFSEITRLPEYYLFRTEMEIFRTFLPQIAHRVGPGAVVVEFGSGSGEKAERLLGSLEDPAAYIPVEIAREQLELSAARVRGGFPKLQVLPVVADFTRAIRLPAVKGLRGGALGRSLAFFPGSTIGNFEPRDAVSFLLEVGTSLGSGAGLLIGFDLVKIRALLEAAYDDPAGVTAAFNLNALHHLNRILLTDFRPEEFEHRAVWNQEASRIEMHLVATRDQKVTIPLSSNGKSAMEIRLPAGGHIVTEHSYKYTLEGFRALGEEAGWETVETWTDDRRWFAVAFLEWRDVPRCLPLGARVPPQSTLMAVPQGNNRI